MPGTIRRIIDRIKEVRSGGNSVVALTVETRLVLQGFDPQRFDHDAPDDAARLARIGEIAGEMNVDIDDLLAEADVAPDPHAQPGPMPRPPVRSAHAPRPGSAHDAPAPEARPAAASTSASDDAGIDADHPLHSFREIADEILQDLEPPAGTGGHAGADLGQLLKASLLMALYSVSSDRALCDQIRHNSLYRWFLALEAGAGRFDAEAFRRDREHVLASEAGRTFFDRLVPWAGRLGLFRSEQLEVNGRLIKSWTSQGSAQR